MAKPNNPGGSRKGKPEHKVLVSGAIQIHRPPDIEQRHTAERKEDSTAHTTEREEDGRREYKKMWLEGLTLLAVVVYALITLWQGCLTRESIDNNTRHFQIDQRPYLWTSNKRPKTNIKVGQRMWANFDLVNYGKSPAIKAAGTGKIFIGPTAYKQSEQWFASLGDRPLVSNGVNEVVVPPGIPSMFTPKTAEDVHKAKPGSASGAPTGEEIEEASNATPEGGFGGGGYFTIVSDAALTKDDVDYILNTDQSIAVAIRFQYFDGFGNRYWSDVCISRFKNGAMPNCDRNNEMH